MYKWTRVYVAIIAIDHGSESGGNKHKPGKMQPGRSVLVVNN